MATLAGTGQYNERYGYDPTGNLTLTVRSGITQTLQYTATNHIHAVTGLDGTQRFLHDANGNVTQRVEFSGTVPITYTQAWDAENRLTVVTNTVTGFVTRFVYDGDGARLLQVRSDGSKTVYPNGLMEIEFPAAAAPPPPSGNIVVNSRTDAVSGTDGLCTLREAIRAANTNTASGAARASARPPAPATPSSSARPASTP